MGANEKHSLKEAIDEQRHWTKVQCFFSDTPILDTGVYKNVVMTKERWGPLLENPTQNAKTRDPNHPDGLIKTTLEPEKIEKKIWHYNHKETE